jgi:hypothetical protein
VVVVGAIGSKVTVAVDGSSREQAASSTRITIHSLKR